MPFFKEIPKINTNLLIMKCVVEHKNNKKGRKNENNTPYILYIKRKAAWKEEVEDKKKGWKR